MIAAASTEASWNGASGRDLGARRLAGGEVLLDRLLDLLEGAHLDLAHALARDAELGGELLEGDRIVGQAARLEDAPLARVEHAEGVAQGREPVLALLLGGQHALLAGAL